MTNFITKYTHASGGYSKAQEEQPGSEETSQIKWFVHVDGSSTNSATRGGVFLVTPEGNELEYAIRFRFKATNNKAEYEVVLTGLCLAHALRAK